MTKYLQRWGFAAGATLLSILTGCGARPAPDAGDLAPQDVDVALEIAQDTAQEDLQASADVSAAADGSADMEQVDDAEIAESDGSAPQDAGDDESAPTDAAEPEADTADAELQGPDGSEAPDAPAPDAVSAPDLGPEDTFAPADAEDGEPDGGVADDAAAPNEEPAVADCDAGDEAWVRAALPFLAGRKPLGSAEVRLLTDLVAAIGRKEVALAMTRLDDFEWTWTSRLYDIAGVPRTGLTVNPPCYGELLHADLKAVHEHIITNSAAVPLPSPASLRDVATAGLRYNDISGFFRATLFGWIARPSRYCANTTVSTQDLARRRLLGAQFAKVWLHRDLGCLGCHNSAFSVTDHSDPAKDRHWPVDGAFEETLFGTPDGAAILPDQFYAIMRVYGVLARASLTIIPPLADETKDWPDDPASPHAPWGLRSECGLFRKDADVLADPTGLQAWLGTAQDKSYSVWDLVASLSKGIEILRKQGAGVDPTQAAADADTAMVWMWSSHLVDEVWREAMGRPLTLPHGFPRNAQQRDRLAALTKAFIGSGWSLRALAVSISLDPLFNQVAPADLAKSEDPACAAARYHQPAVLEPFALDEANPSRRLNSTGDRVHREHPVVLVRSAALLAGWPEMPMTDKVANPLFEEQVLLQQPWWLLAFSLGQFQNELDGGQRGLSAEGYATWRQSVRDCKLAYPGAQPVGSSLPGGADLIGALATLATPQTTLRDAVGALWDRLLAQPTLSASAEAAVAKAFAVASLDTPLAAVPNASARLRRLCGTLLASPQFMLAGLPQPKVGSATPALVLPGMDYQALCNQLGPQLLPKGAWLLTCSPAGVQVSAVSSSP